MSPEQVEAAIRAVNGSGNSNGNGNAPAAGSLATDGLEHAAQGYKIVPGIAAEKRPVIRTGPAHGDAATTDEAAIKGWARRFPEADALIPCKINNITVLDGDTKAGFDADAFVADHPEFSFIRTGAAPPVSAKYPNSREGMRGVQVYFRDEEGTFTGDIAEVPGAEFRSHGALVVGPGARHRSGVCYEGELPPVDELPALPDYMRNWTPASATRTSTARLTPLDKIPPGGGMHNHLWDYGVRAVAGGVTDPDLLANILIVEHQQRAVPGGDYGVRDYSSLRKMARDLANGTVAENVKAEAEADAWLDVAAKAATAANALSEEEAISTRGLPAFPDDVFRGAALAQHKENTSHGLADPLSAGPLIAATATAIGNNAVLEVDGSRQYAAPFIATVAEPGSGKSPAADLAFRPVRKHDDALEAVYRDELQLYRKEHKEYMALKPAERATTEEPRRPIRGRITTEDLTLESLARTLHDNHGAVAIVIDELSGMMRSDNRYRGGVGNDREKRLSLWSNQRWELSRVGQGGQHNAIEISIRTPVVVMFGTIQFSKIHHLGTGGDGGHRDRILIFASDSPAPTNTGFARTLPVWENFIDQLIEARYDLPTRVWKLSESAYERFITLRYDWQTRARHLGHATAEGGALAKADIQALRLTLILAEMDEPARHDGVVSLDVLERAAKLVEFSVGCWADIADPDESYAHSFKARAIERGVPQLFAFLRGRPEGAARRDIQRRQFPWANTTEKLNELLYTFHEMYPGNVKGKAPERDPKTGKVRGQDRRRFFDSKARRDAYEAEAA
jgi:hypothetical protein